MLSHYRESNMGYNFTKQAFFCPQCGATYMAPDIKVDIQVGDDLSEYSYIHFNWHRIVMTDAHLRNEDSKGFLFSAPCPQCMKNHNYAKNMILVDFYMAEPLADLNKAGAFTEYSCFGHTDEDPNDNDAYIKFVKPLTPMLVEKLLSYGVKTNTELGNRYQFENVGIIFKSHKVIQTYSEYEEYVRWVRQRDYIPLFEIDMDEFNNEGTMFTVIRLNDEITDIGMKIDAFDLLVKTITEEPEGVQYCNACKNEFHDYWT